MDIKGIRTIPGPLLLPHYPLDAFVCEGGALECETGEHGELVVGVRLCIPSAVVPAVERPAQNLAKAITIRFGLNRR